MVMGIHNTCVKVKKFLTGLKNAIAFEETAAKEAQDADKSLLGKLKSLVGLGKNDVSTNAIVDAAIGDNFRGIEKLNGMPESLQRIRNNVGSVNQSELKGNNGKTDWVYYGEHTNGLPKGYGTIFYPDGEIQRGQFGGNGSLTGLGEKLLDGGQWLHVGEFDQGKRNGDGALAHNDGEILHGKFSSSGQLAKGTRIWPDGSRFEGTFDNSSQPSYGKSFRADGTLKEEGHFERMQLVLGKSFAANGVDSVEIDRFKERNAAADAARAAEERRKQEIEGQKQAELKRQRDAQVAIEQAYRDSLNSMNAGQLFATADELASKGDKVKARDVLRTLVSRFPDHPLAMQAAQQMSSASTAATSASGTTQAGNGGSCWDVLAKKEKEYEAINRKPMPQGATPPLMRVMWMTSDSIKVIDANCAGDAKAAKYRAELQQSFNQAKTACEQLSTGGCTPNPYDGRATQEDAQAAASRAEERKEAAEAERERLAEQKRVQDLQNLSNALTNLANTLDKRKKGAAGGAGPCPPGLNLVNGTCRSGVAQ